MPSLYSSLALLAASVATLVSAQCQNNVAVYNPNVRTMTANSSKHCRITPRLPFIY